MSVLSAGSVLLHDNLSSQATSFFFARPQRVVTAFDQVGARQALAEIEAALDAGLWAAGFFSYELGYGFEERLKHRLSGTSAVPLVYMGLFDAPARLTAHEVDAMLAAAADGQAADVAPLQDFADYEKAFDAAKALIAAGDIYQVNLTLKAQFTLEGHALGLYRRLAESQKVAYGAYIDTGKHKILSRSPELFVSGEGDVLRARPMKGTLKRGRTIAEDFTGRAALAADEKNRAENLMIVDLLRNDLGRIAEMGSVKVTDLFTVETYRSLHTMVSGIEARKRADVGLTEVLENLFPCGSITGAPKLRAMEIIHALEAGPRGVYTGSIGYIAPNGDFAFNVAIRTAVIDATGRGEIGIGGGIVADSEAEAEYEEALLKLNFLSQPAAAVTLIETLKWTPDEGFWLLERHFQRMADSAAYFSLPFDREALAEILERAAEEWTAPMRVRLTLGETGPDLTAVPLPANPDVFRFVIASEKLESGSIWLAHKTTKRDCYDRPRQEAQKLWPVDEVVFLNERDELAEGSITNLFVEKDGLLLTPPLSSGLLPGTLRAELLANGRARETVLFLADLANADAIWLGNSVRGLIRAELFEPKDAAP
jgi:para-aminobenzoate synthetase/4-amino-4-deoxychorismate lyase